MHYTIENLKVHFDKLAEQYNDALIINAYASPCSKGYLTEEVVENTISDVINKLLLDPAASLLDLGCGSGFWTKRLANIIRETVGVDMSKKILEIAKKQKIPNATFICGAGHNLPFQENSFDRILSLSVFMNFPDYHYARSVLNEMVRVTKPGGIILIANNPSLEKKEEFLKYVDLQQLKFATSPNRDGLAAAWRKLSNLIRRVRNKMIKNWVTVPAINVIYYPASIFEDYCAAKKMNCEILERKIEGDIYAPFRFDVRITVIK
jgi:ubiquinone/menaquinone biosynthesis C-methylase UbiE